MPGRDIEQAPLTRCAATSANIAAQVATHVVMCLDASLPASTGSYRFSNSAINIGVWGGKLHQRTNPNTLRRYSRQSPRLRVESA